MLYSSYIQQVFACLPWFKREFKGQGGTDTRVSVAGQAISLHAEYIAVLIYGAWNAEGASGQNRLTDVQSQSGSRQFVVELGRVIVHVQDLHGDFYHLEELSCSGLNIISNVALITSRPYRRSTIVSK